MYLHINTCIHPHNVTLYTLPADQLAYVLAYLEEQRDALLTDYPQLANLASYDFLLSLIRSELGSRKPGWEPELTNLNRATDGLLAAPRPGLSPFDTPASVLREAERAANMLDRGSAERMLGDMAAGARQLGASPGWLRVSERISDLVRGVARR